MKSIRQQFSAWTLRFINTDIESSYQETKMSFEDLPLIGRITVFGTVLLALVRRYQLLFDSIYGTKMYSAYDETRATIEFTIGVFLEFVFGFVKPLNFLRGTGITVCGFLSIMDSSCFYYPAEPSIIPM